MGAVASCDLKARIVNGEGDLLVNSMTEIFVDDSFPNVTSHWPTDKVIEYKRISEIGNGRIFGGLHDPTPSDFLPGLLSNPSFLAAISSLCMVPDYIKTMFIAYNSAAGCAVLRLWHHGVLKTVVIDDLIPCWTNMPKAIVGVQDEINDGGDIEDNEDLLPAPVWTPLYTFTHTGV